MRGKPFGVLSKFCENGFDNRTIDTRIDMRNHTNREWGLRGLNWHRCMCTRFVERRLQLALIVEKVLFGLFHRNVTTLHKRFHVHLS